MKLSLYKTIDEDLFKKAKVHVSEVNFYYENNYDQINSHKVIKEVNGDKNIVINELIEDWSPTENDFNITQKFIIENPKILFGSSGVTHQSNIIGMACHVYSKTSNYQKTISFADFNSYDSKVEAEFNYTFPPGNLYGSIFFDYFFYLKESNEILKFTTDLVGINLCENFIDSYNIIIDGNGSEFPIEEINDPSKPLWMVKTNWTDIYQDTFSNNSFRLILNQGHPLFEQFVGTRYKVSQHLMSEAISSAITLVVQQAIIIEKNNLEDSSEIVPGSIAQVIKYWIDVFSIETESLESIANSVRKSITSN
ncbi:hypothetical protein [Facklamia sp. 7083-14-GEN3]|uniref:hypothetical protein n=1 Tax=Facklamia sp. 7083-14-GEN3 TaxID=2973478 RepID=UPI00215BDC95|nr:hypothetical protein [Facklamia sp. 7083-14-GEN3]MCR8968462.1 hypothetical protein [Facklamia sp. 7083-14-GEN3]